MIAPGLATGRHAGRRILPALLLTAMAGAGTAQETFSDCEDCPTMVVVPAGSVTLGSTKNEAYRRQGERERQRVEIGQAFGMARTEVTLGQYRRFVEETGHEPELLEYEGETVHGCNYFDGAGYGYVARHSWDDPGYPQREDAPVVCVSWSDADRYAEWLSRRTGRAYRVPSAAEFEYALRAGAQTPWFWGADPSAACEFANIADRSFGRVYPERPQFACTDRYVYAAPVARFDANAFGLHDMMGNVWEWTNDCWHDDLSSAPLDGSHWSGDDGGDCRFRTPKGGSWLSGPGWARAAARSRDHEHYRSFMLGFRVAAVIDE